MKFIPQQPFVLPYADRRSDTAVLFLHGITEGPEQFRRPAAWANDLGFDAAAAVLPGHGGSAGTFARSGREEWEAFVHSLTDEYRLRYPRLILVGHSMGGLLALRTWTRRPDGIAGIVCVGCPLHVWVSTRAVRDLLGVRYGRADASDERLAILRALNVAPGPTPGYVRWLPRLRDLFTLMADVATSWSMPAAASAVSAAVSPLSSCGRSSSPRPPISSIHPPTPQHSGKPSARSAGACRRNTPPLMTTTYLPVAENLESKTPFCVHT